MTRKTSIRFALGVVAALALGAALLSLNSLGRIINTIEQISVVDTRTAQLGESLSILFLEARSHEKNFIITLDSTCIESNRNIMNAIKQSIGEAYYYAPEYYGTLDSLLNLIAEYGHGIGQLVMTVKENPRSLNRLQSRLISYEKEIRRLQERGRITRDAAEQLSMDMSLDIEAAASAVSNEKAVIFTGLRRSADAILESTQNITRQARADLIRHAGIGRQEGIKAQRNSLYFLFGAVLLVIYLIIVFPDRLFKPLGKIIRMLKAIERGEENISFIHNEDDEFGTLSIALESALKKLQLFNYLKSGKITDNQRHLQNILDSVDAPILFLSTDLDIYYANMAAREFWDSGSLLMGQSVKNLSQLWNAAEDTIENIQRRGRTELSVRLSKRNLIRKKLIILPNMAKNGTMETIVIIVK
ncbi:hypothetical protein KAR48_06155 [bacterium]|nr:hypothetical protein [bacterium]